MLALKVALNSALISASCFTALTETTFAPKPEVALRVYCVAVRSAILATAWLLVTILSPTYTQLELCNKIINKDPTSPQMCCYTTL